MIPVVFEMLLAGVVTAALALILRPLGRTERNDVRQRSDEKAAAREAAIEALREINLDYQLGNLAEADYRSLYERQKQEAIRLLRTPERSQQTKASGVEDSEIEEAVRALRARRQAVRSGVGAVGRSSSSATSVFPRADRVRPDLVGEAPGSRTGRGQHAAPRAPRKLTWLLGACLALGVSLGGIAWLYFSDRSAQQKQSPISQLPSGTERVRTLSIVAGGNGLVLLGHEGGLLASSDRGTTWTAGSVGGEVVSVLAEQTPGGAVYLGGRNLFLVSKDGGKSWAARANDLPGLDVQALAGDPAAPDVLYAVLVDHGLFRSVDGGSHWTMVADQLPGSVTDLVVTGGPNRALYLSTSDQGVFTSDDGRTWSHASGALNGALPTWSVATLAYDPLSGDRYVGNDGREYDGSLYAGTDQGVFKSVDGGGSWVRLSLAMAVAAFAIDPADSRLLLAVGRDNRVYRSEDRGLTWRSGR